MKENFKQLYSKFKKVNKMGWLKSIRKGSTGIGATFEHLIGKEEENFEIPDFCGIEIKTQRNNTISLITLFNATPDGSFLFEIQRLVTTFGYPDKVLKDCKVLKADAYGNRYNLVANKYYFKLKVDYKVHKVFLHIYDYYYSLIDKKTYWTFELLYEKIYRKLQYLAVIYADSRFINGEEYFLYKKIDYYKLKDFSVFFKLIEQGKVRVTFKVGVFRSGKRYKQLHDHGTGFAINSIYINELFDKITL